jgi:Dolichyl-phosphate-mannose-protein mannosyltransferase
MLDCAVTIKRMDNGTKPRTRFASYFFLLLTVSVSTLLLAARIHDAFDPADDPVLAHAAERVLHGQRPHVDFHDIYAGGLSYLDAASFKLFGTSLLAPRIMLLLFFVPAVAAIWYIASRMLGPAAASIVTLLAAAWSVPLYPCPMASWYMLYFAIFATAALFCYIETRNRRWIFAAGAFAGIAILFKVTGVYAVAAGMLFLLFDEQSGQARDGKGRLSAFSVVISGLLLLFCSALAFLVRSHPEAAEYYHFVLPGALLSALLIYREWQSRHLPTVARARALAGRLLPFLAGACIPIAAYLAPYMAAGQVGLWFHDVFIAPFARLQSAYWAAVAPIAVLLSLPVFALTAIDAGLRSEKDRRIAMAGSCLGCAAAIYLSLRYPYFAGLTWLSAAAAIPLLSVVAAVLLMRTGPVGKSTSQFLLLVVMTAMCSLNQYPFSRPIYFCYVAPLLILAIAALVAIRPHPGPFIMAPVAVFFLVFAVAILMPNQIYSKGLTLHPDVQKAFSLPRAGRVRGSIDVVERYERVCDEIAAHGGSGSIYAGPDASGLYFLTGRENPTPILFDFLAGDDARPDRILAAINRAGVGVVVINHAIHIPSGPMPAELLNALRSQFPESRTIDNFEIRWR